jgi:hypothetical protein
MAYYTRRRARRGRGIISSAIKTGVKTLGSYAANSAKQVASKGWNSIKYVGSQIKQGANTAANAVAKKFPSANKALYGKYGEASIMKANARWPSTYKHTVDYSAFPPKLNTNGPNNYFMSRDISLKAAPTRKLGYGLQRRRRRQQRRPRRVVSSFNYLPINVCSK